jgi:hypothetical protein
MKKFFLKSILFLISSCVLIFLCLFFLKMVLKNNLIIESDAIKYKTLILGDSQIQNGLDDLEIENSLNVAKGGDPIFYNYIKLKALYDLGVRPDRLILGWTPQNFTSNGFYDIPKTKDKLSRYFFLLDLKDYKDIIKYNPEGFFKGIINFLFNSFTKKMLLFKTNIKNADIGGFWTLPSNISDFYLEKDILNTENIERDEILSANDMSLKYLDKIINFCNTNNIKIVLISMPNYKSLNLKNKSIKKVFDNHIITLKDKVVYWDYSDYIGIEKKHFYNEDHLNENGAIIISSLLNKRIKSITK